MQQTNYTFWVEFVYAICVVYIYVRELVYREILRNYIKIRLLTYIFLL